MFIYTLQIIIIPLPTLTEILQWDASILVFLRHQEISHTNKHHKLVHPIN